MSNRTARSSRAGFTIVEILIGVGLTAMLLALIAMLARYFLFTFLWSGETFSGVHEASFLHATLRRDLARIGLKPDGRDLALEQTGQRAVLTLPKGAGVEKIEYRLDPKMRVLWRQPENGPAQPLGLGMVKDVQLSRVYVRKRPGPTYVLAGSIPAGERPFRAGVRFKVVLQGQDLGAGGGPVRSIEFSTHMFPVFANLRLSSIWKPAGNI